MEKADDIRVEDASQRDIESHNKTKTADRAGNTRYFEGTDILLVPTPSNDPKDPLNYPSWKKWTILILVAAYSSTAVILSSGMGAISTVVKLDYPGQEMEANDLMTYPTLFMGVGNLISMPLALVIGRRPVFLFSLLLMTLAGVWCAVSGSLASHIAGRNIMSLAAGQSEALSPMMVQEIHFLHERSGKIVYFIFIQNVCIGAFFIATQFLVDAHGWRWWYGLFTIINGAALLLAFFFAAETGYNRPESDMVGESEADLQDDSNGKALHHSVTLTEQRTRLSTMDTRRWSDGLGLFLPTRNWKSIPSFYLNTLQGFAIWPITWIFLLNGAFLGVYIFMSATFAPTLIMPPYLLPFTSLAYVQGAQIIVVLIFLPVLGYGGDWVVKRLVKRNNSMFKPELRLFQLAIPAVTAIICTVIYGQAAKPHDPTAAGGPSPWSWASIAVSYNAAYFGFLGANIVGITYAVDSFPTRAGPLLVLICAGRGIVSFGLSFATLPAVASVGYDGIMNIMAVICGVLSLVAVPVYFWGPRARVWANAKFDITRGAAVREEEQEDK